MDQWLSSTFVLGTVLLLRDDLILRTDGLEAFTRFADVADDFGDGYCFASLVCDLKQDA